MPTIASLNVNLTANVASFSKALTSAGDRIKYLQASLSKIGTYTAAAGAAITGSMIGAVKVFANTADQIQKMSLRTGIAAEELSALKHAADLSDVSFKDLGTAIARMQRAIIDGSKGFQKLGIDVATLRGLTPERQFGIIADAINSVNDPALKAAAAMDLFGRSGTNLFPLIEGGSASIGKMTQEARDLGLVIGTDAANAGAAFNDSLTKITKAITALSVGIGNALAPALTDLIEKFTKLVGELGKVIANNQGLTKSVFILGASLLALGVTIKGVSLAFTFFSGLIGTVIKSIVAMVNAVKALTGAMLVLAIASGGMVSSVALIAAGVAAVGVAVAAAIAYFVDWGGVFEWIGGLAGKVFGGIGDQMDEILAKIDGVAGGVGDIQDKTNPTNRAAFIQKQQAKPKAPEIPGVSNFAAVGRNLLKPVDELGKAVGAVNGIFGNALGTALLQNAKNFLDRPKELQKGLDQRGPDLITKGSREAFTVGQRNSQRNVEDKTEENTRNTYKAVVKLANEISKGLKIDIQNIEAFAQ